MKEERQYEARNPGPRAARRSNGQRNDCETTLTSNNISSHEKHEGHVKTLETGFHFWQEIKMNPRHIKSKTAMYREVCKSSEFGPPDGEARILAAGVGATAQLPDKLTNVKPNVKELAIAIANGRCRITSIHIPTIGSCNVYNVYCWTGGDQEEEARQRTDDLCSLISRDMETRPGEHCILCGDVNASRGRIASLEAMIIKHQLTDIGQVASRWGDIDEQITCRASTTSNESRIDFMMLSIGLMEHVKDFQVVFHDQVPTHAALRLTFKHRADPKKVYRNCRPADFEAIIEKRIQKQSNGKDVE